MSLKKLAERIYPANTRASLSAQFRMIRNLPKLVNIVLSKFDELDLELKSQKTKSNQQSLAPVNANVDLESKVSGKIDALENSILTRDGKIDALENSILTRDGKIDALENSIRARDELIVDFRALERKRDFQLQLLTFEIQNQIAREGGALLRETCFTHWWYVLSSSEPHEKAFKYFELIKDLPVSLLDIGANTGISALSVHKCAPEWPIVSIEGLGIMEPMLKLTKRYLDSVGARFDFKICGLGKEDCGMQKMQVAVVDGQYLDTMATFTPGQFEKDYIRDYIKTLSPNGWDGRIVEVETVVNKLDSMDLGLKNPLVFVKMDVEGYELEVLPGMREFLSTRKPGIVMESDAPQGVADVLQTMGYLPTFYHYSEARGGLVVSGGVCEESQGNYFFFTKDSPLFIPASA